MSGAFSEGVGAVVFMGESSSAIGLYLLLDSTYRNTAPAGELKKGLTGSPHPDKLNSDADRPLEEVHANRGDTELNRRSDPPVDFNESLAEQPIRVVKHGGIQPSTRKNRQPDLTR